MGLLHDGWMVLAALLPSIGLLYLFYVVMKHMVEGDRRERAALRQLEAEENLKALPTSDDAANAQGSPGSDLGPGSSSSDPSSRR